MADPKIEAEQSNATYCREGTNLANEQATISARSSWNTNEFMHNFS